MVKLMDKGVFTYRLIYPGHELINPGPTRDPSWVDLFCVYTTVPLNIDPGWNFPNSTQKYSHDVCDVMIVPFVQFGTQGHIGYGHIVIWVERKFLFTLDPGINLLYHKLKKKTQVDFLYTLDFRPGSIQYPE